jgi:hypothetical protein
MIAMLMLWPFWRVTAAGGETSPAGPSSFLLEIRSVAVHDQSLSWGAGEEVRLPPFPENISFHYGAASNSSRAPMRLRYKLEGYDQAWREGYGEMYLAIRFLNESGYGRKTRLEWRVKPLFEIAGTGLRGRRAA